MAPLLSVVTVVKDDPLGFKRTCESLEAAHYFTNLWLEWVVIDSSSKPIKIQEFTQSDISRTRVIWTPPMGVFSAMNTALREISGDYVFYLNAGDSLASPEVLTELRESLDANEPKWLYGEVAFLSPDGTGSVPPRFDYSEEKRHYFARGRFPPHQGTIARTREVRALGGFDDSYRIAGDYALMLRLAEVSDPVEIETVVAEFRLDGISQHEWLLAVREFHKARQRVLAPRGKDYVHEMILTLLGLAAMACGRGLSRARSLWGFPR